LEERSALRRDPYLTTQHSQHETSMPPVGYELAIPASERSQIDALDRVATGIGTYEIKNLLKPNIFDSCNSHTPKICFSFSYLATVCYSNAARNFVDVCSSFTNKCTIKLGKV